MLGQPINSLIKPSTNRWCRIAQVSLQAQAQTRADCPYQINAINRFQMRRLSKQSVISTCIVIFLTSCRCGNQTRRLLLDFNHISKSELCMNDQFNSPIQSPCKHLHAANIATHMSSMTWTKLGRRPADTPQLDVKRTEITPLNQTKVLRIIKQATEGRLQAADSEVTCGELRLDQLCQRLAIARTKRL